MTTNEKICKWLGYKKYNLMSGWHEHPQYGLFQPDFRYNCNQQKWIIEKLIELGYIIAIVIDKEGTNVTINKEDYDDYSTIYGKTEGEALLSAVEQLIDQENEKR